MERYTNIGGTKLSKIEKRVYILKKIIITDISLLRYS